MEVEAGDRYRELCGLVWSGVPDPVIRCEPACMASAKGREAWREVGDSDEDVFGAGSIDTNRQGTVKRRLIDEFFIPHVCMVVSRRPVRRWQRQAGQGRLRKPGGDKGVQAGW